MLNTSSARLKYHDYPTSYIRARSHCAIFTARVRSTTGGYVFSLFTIAGEGGTHPIMLCNITQNSMGPWGRHLGGGYPARSSWGGTHPIMLCNITQNSMGQTGGVPGLVQLGGTLPGQDGGYPARSRWGVPSQVLTQGVPWPRYPLFRSWWGYLATSWLGGTMTRVPPGMLQPQQGTPLAGYSPAGHPLAGYPQQGTPWQCTPPGRVPPRQGTPPGQVPTGGCLRSRRRTVLFLIASAILLIATNWLDRT